jgi:hypothetical protein
LIAQFSKTGKANIEKGFLQEEPRCKIEINFVYENKPENSQTEKKEFNYINFFY